MNVAIILAAGKGKRFDSLFPKQLAELNGKTILEYSLDIVESLASVEMTILVIDPVYETTFKKITQKYTKRIELCPGGATRQQSVYQALELLSEMIIKKEEMNVLIHDSARPFAQSVFKRVLNKLNTYQAIVPVVKTKDTIYVIKDKQLVDIPCRDHLYNVQTPQGFSFKKIFDCHKIAIEKMKFDFSDDGSLYLAFQKNQPVIVDGDQMNFKITDKKDMLLAEYYLSKRTIN